MPPAKAMAAATLTKDLRISAIFPPGMRRIHCERSTAFMRRLLFLPAIGKLVEEIEEQRDKHKCKRARANHPADDARSQRVSGIHARAHCDPQRHATEDKGQ